MTEKLKGRNFPTLRFKDNNGDEFPKWNVKFGNDIFQNISDKNHNSDLPILAITQEYGAVPRDLIDYKISVTDKSIESYKVVQKGDFIISLRSFQGGIEYSEYKGICSPAYIILRPSVPIDNIFYKYYLKTPKYITHLNRKLEGIRDGKMISYKYFSDITLPLPSIAEQNKISSFLSLIEARIQTQKKIIEQLETLIKVFREKIFSGTFRFKDDQGNNLSSWVPSTLENICHKESSNISANKIEDNFGNYIIYGASGVLKKVDFYEEENDYISIVKDGAGVGRLFFCEGKSSVLGTMEIIKPKLDVNVQFLFYQLSNIDFTKYVTGSTIPHIYFKDYKNEKVKIPSKKEQTKIANFLSSIDEKIEIEKKILAQYELQKKYLLANLFA